MYVCIHVHVHIHTHIHTHVYTDNHSCTYNHVCTDAQMANLQVMYKRREASLTSRASQYETEVAALQVHSYLLMYLRLIYMHCAHIAALQVQLAVDTFAKHACMR